MALAVITGSYIFTGWAVASNRFFSAVVRIQKERSHSVVTSGPYRFVRHPGYAGGIFFNPALPVMLGSIWALIPAGIVVIATVVRTALEDRILRNELEGYVDYARRVKHRLLPGIW